jgi:diguanylate cyclase (GGDEF)-like protein
LRVVAAAAAMAFAVDLVVICVLLWPELVPAPYRRPLRVVDFGLTSATGLLLAVLLVDLFRLFKAGRDTLARQQMLFDALPNALALWSPDDRLEHTNADFVRLYAPLADLIVPGRRFEDLLRGAVERGLVPEAQGREEFWLAERMAAHRHPGGPMVRKMPDGRWRRIVEQRLPDGRLLSHSIDVSELVAARAEVELAQRRLEDAIEVLPAGFELYDADDRMIAANSALKSMYPRVADLLDEQRTWEELVRENLRRGGLPAFEANFEEWLKERRAQRSAGGSPRVQALPDNRWIRTYEQRTREGGIVGVRIDVSEVMLQDRELRRLNAELDTANLELRRIAGTDPLTGISNRRTFDERLARIWESGVPVALLLLDVDHFKRYNDRHGHSAGDAVLRRVAAVLVASARGRDDLVARIGGEEFAVLLPSTDSESAWSAAQRCLGLLADADIAHGDSPVGSRVTASVGLALRSMLPRVALPAGLVDLADVGLYEAKAQGRNRVVVAGGLTPPA